MIAIATGCSESYQELEDVTLPSKRAYAEKWGMALATRRFGDNEIAWERIRFVKELLPKFDAVIWMDCDAFVANQNFDVRQDIVRHQFMISPDINSINTGVFIVRNTPLVRQFLHVILNEGYYHYKNHIRAEQHAIRDYMSHEPYLGLVTVMHYRYMQSLLTHNYPDWDDDFRGKYEPGDWMVHMPGMTNEKRISECKKILNA